MAKTEGSFLKRGRVRVKNLKAKTSRFIPGIFFACMMSFFLEVGIKDHFWVGLLWADAVSAQYIQSGKTLFAAGYLEEARQYFERAAEVDPNDAKAFAHIGAVCAAKENFNEAVGFYEKALDLSPNNCEILGSLGYNFFKLGKTKKAIEYYEKNLEFCPHDIMAKAWLEYLRR